MPISRRAQFDIHSARYKLLGGFYSLIQQLIRFRHFVNQPSGLGRFSTDGLSDGNHFQPIPKPDKSRQPLRTACTGNQSELNLGLSEIHLPGRYPVVTDHSNLKATA